MQALHLVSSLGVEAVICAGGATDVERCESDPQWAMTVNCDGPAALAAACRDRPFVFFSTDYIFDGVEGPYCETSTATPISVYGRSKWLGEQRVQQAHPNALILRTTVVYGPDRQRKNFLYTLNRMLSAGQPMRVANDQISSPTYNQDLAAATLSLIKKGYEGVFHVAGPEFISRLEFARIAAQVLHLDTALLTAVLTADLGQKAPRPLRSGLRTEKLVSALGSNCMRPSRAGVEAWAARSMMEA